MDPFQYACSIEELFTVNENSIIGALTKNNNFDTNRKTVESWSSEIKTLKIALRPYQNEDGFVAFEYTIPRVDGRIDCVIGLRGIVFVLEFKTGESQDEDSEKEQILQYVTDLKNFHYESYDVPIAPLWVIPDASLTVPTVRLPKKNDNVLSVITVCNSTIERTFEKILHLENLKTVKLERDNWLYSPYCPTTNIVDAARKLYANHNVEEINMTGAGGEDLIRTTNTLLNLIEQAKSKKEKYLCLVTGVPGAGKTLIGLSVATMHQNEEHNNRSVYLSGNRPLVMVLQEALSRDAYSRQNDKLKEELEKFDDKAERRKYKSQNKVNKAFITSQIKQFIQLVPNWRSEYVKGTKVENGDLVKDEQYQYKGTADWYVPYDHVSIYDEAQRAWEMEENRNYIRKKEAHLKETFPDWSEPRLLISCMDRHQDWAVYICLIGNGQDINHGEAGTIEWIKSMAHFGHWKVYAPSNILADPSIKTEIEDKEENKENREEFLKILNNITYIDGLHLSTDLRSIRAENLAHFVDHMLNLKTEEAREILAQLDRYPIRLTRDLNVAKAWIKQNARENERYGALASSKGQRLKPDALVLLPTNTDRPTVIHWFLGGKDLVSSSYYMEDAATEFQVQGLELDWALVAWDADMRYTKDGWKQMAFRGSKWQNIKNGDIKRYQINAYRVILTRARRGMVIYVPKGSDEDKTRNRSYYDGTYHYLKDLGIKEI